MGPVPIFSAGSASVSIVPDFSHAQTAIGEFFARQRDVKVKVEPDLSQSDVARTEAELNAMHGSAKVEVDRNVLSSSITGAIQEAMSRSGLEKLGGVLTGAIKPTLITAVAGAFTELAAAASQAVGVVALAPALLMALAAPAAVVALGVQGMGAAFKALDTGNAAQIATTMGRLTPAAQELVLQIHALRPAWDAMKLDVQSSLFAGVGTAITNLAHVALPILRTGLVDIAGAMNGGLLATLTALQGQGANFTTLFGNIANSIRVANAAAAPLIQAFMTLAAVGSQFLPQLAAGFVNVATKFNDWVQHMAATGQLVTIIQNAINVLKELGQLAGNLIGIVSGIFSAALPFGNLLLQMLIKLTGSLSSFIHSADAQSALQDFFSSITTAMGILLPALGTLVQALVQYVLPAIGQFAALLAPIAATLLVQLAAALKAVAAILPPVVQVMAALFNAMAPLIPVISQIITTLLPPLVGFFGQLAPIIGQVSQILGGALLAAAKAIAPVLPQIGAAIIGILNAVLPLLPPLLSIAERLLPPVLAIVTALLPIVREAVSVFAQIAGVFLQIASATVLPLIVTLLDAFAAGLKVLSPILGPLAGIILAIVAAVKIWTAVQALLDIALDANPIGAIVLAISALIIAIGLIVTHLQFFKDVFGSVMDWVTQHWRLLVAAIPGLGPVILLIITIVQHFGDIWQAVVSGLKTAWDAVVGALQTALNAFVGFWEGIWNTVSSFVVRIWTDITTFLKRIWTDIAGFFVSIFNTVGSFWTNLWNTVSSFVVRIWTAIAGELQKQLDSIVSTWEGRWNAVSSFFVRIWNDISAFFQRIWNSIYSWFAGQLNVLDALWQRVWTDVSTFFQTTWNNISSFFVRIWNAILSFFVGQLNQAQSVWQRVWTDVSTFFQTTWNNISSFFVRIWNAILSFLVGQLNQAQSVWQTAWTAVSTFFVNTWNNISSFFVQIWNTIYSWFAGQLNALSTLWQQIWSGISTFFVTIWNNISSFFQTTWNNIATWFGQQLNTFKQIFIGVFNDISTALSGIWQGILTAAQVAWDGLKAIVEAPIKFVVNTVVDGFIHGVNAVMHFLGLSWTIPDVVLPFAEGGFTGDGMYGTGGKHDPAGIVHAREFVVNQEQTAKHLPLLQAINSGVAGYADGGLVGNIMGLFTDPAGTLVSYVKGLFGPGAGTGPFADMITAIPIQMAQNMAAWVGKEVKDGIGAALKAGGQLASAVGNALGSALGTVTSALGLNSGLSGQVVPSSRAANVAAVNAVAAAYGWGTGVQWNDLVDVIMRESGFNNTAQNPTSTAYGMFQFLDSTWAQWGGKTSDPHAQSVYGLQYIASRYGTPAGALAHENAYGWYDGGGWLAPGYTTVYNGTGGFEAVLNQAQQNAVVGAATRSFDGVPTWHFYLGDREITDLVDARVVYHSGRDGRTIRSSM